MGDDGTKTSAFQALNPNGKISAIIDPDGLSGKGIGLLRWKAIQ